MPVAMGDLRLLIICTTQSSNVTSLALAKSTYSKMFSFDLRIVSYSSCVSIISCLYDRVNWAPCTIFSDISRTRSSSWLNRLRLIYFSSKTTLNVGVLTVFVLEGYSLGVLKHAQPVTYVLDFVYFL